MTEPEHKDDQDDFRKAAANERERGLVAEFLGFMAENRAWWMTPILVVLALVAVLLGLVATGAAPFLYSFF